MGKHWIVLVNRAPRGPLSLEEVNSLLQEKLISRTDLALQISDDSAQKSSWKFLWQFPEFDLRAQSQTNTKAESQAGVEQRKPINPQEVQKKISSILPDEFALISPEDLIITAKKNRSRSSEIVYSDSLEIDEADLNYSKTPGPKGFRWGYAAVMVCFLVFGVYVKGLFFSQPENQKSVAQPGRSALRRIPTIRVPARMDALPPVNANSVKNEQPSTDINSRPHLQHEDRKETPKPPGMNVITLDEYQKLRDANAAKERAEEEDKQRAMEESDEMTAQKSEDENNENDENRGDEQVEEEAAPRSKASKRKKLKSASSKRKLAEESSNEDESSRTENDSRSDE